MIPKNIVANEKFKKEINAWQPRKIDQTYINSLLNSNSCDPVLPEFSLLRFLEAWQDGNYSEMAKRLYYFNGKTIGRIAGDLRKNITNEIIEFHICDVRETALAATEIDIDVKYKNLCGGELKLSVHTARLINEKVYEGTNENKWVIVEISLSNLLYGI